MVHCEVDFKHPLRFGDRPIVRVTCTKLGHASIALHYVYRLDDTVCVDARTVVACIDLDTMKSIPVPAEFRKRLEDILEPAAPTSDLEEDA
jgi:4-hydroxybenzoyl-CoA thioesterase